MAPPPDEDDAFAGALAAERLHNGRRLAWLRLLGISGFFVLTVVAGRVLDPTWSRSIALFAVHWLIAVGLFWLSYRRGALFRIAGLEVALVDVPTVFLLQCGMLNGVIADRGIAGFSAGDFLNLMAIAGLGLDPRATVATATR